MPSPSRSMKTTSPMLDGVGTVTSALSSSLVGSSSNWSLAATAAVLVRTPSALTSAVRVRVTEFPNGSAPTVHTPLVPS